MSLRSEVIRIFNELTGSAKKISDLPAAGSVDGTDLVEISKNGVSMSATASQIGAGGSGVVQTIVAGTNITVDDTDPANPIVSATGGGGAVDSVNGQTGVVVLDAGDISNTPAGGIAATDVQAAINELDTEKAPLASPAFTGTPTAPTAANGTNTTQLATTAFVQQEVPSASETAAGKVELATAAETLTGTDNTRAVHPAGAKATYANGLAATDTTGTAIAFAVPQIYGSIGSPETGNITINTTGLVKGMTQLLIHNNGTEPTYGSEITIISGAYATGEANFIMLMAVSSSLILVTISQEV